MASKDDKKSNETHRQMPAMTPEEREDQMIALADSLAERQLREGTASSQVLVHYLKMGTTMHQKDLEKAKLENLLLEEKVELMRSQQRADDMMDELYRTIKRYSGTSDEDEDGEEYYVN